MKVSRKKVSHVGDNSKNKKSLWEEMKRNKFFYLISIPVVIFLIMFNYIPMAGIYVAFEKYNFEGGLFGSEFVGLANFKVFLVISLMLCVLLEIHLLLMLAALF